MSNKDKYKESELTLQARSCLKKPAKPESGTGYKGVSLRKSSNRFYCIVWQKDKPKKSIGGFATAIEAAKAYDSYIRENVGEWAYTNFLKNGHRRVVK